MSQLVPNAIRGGRVSLPNSAANVSAGNYTGTNALDGALVGTASGRTKVRSIQFRAQGTTVENWLRVYLKQGSTYTYLFSIHIPAITPNLSEKRLPWSYMHYFADRGPGEQFLYDATTRLAYQLEATPGSVIDILETVVDYA